MESVVDLIKALGPLIAAIGACIGAWHARGGRKDMQTNHGKRPGEYIEAGANDAAELKALLADHTLQDANNFSDLSKQIASLRMERH